MDLRIKVKSKNPSSIITATKAQDINIIKNIEYFVKAKNKAKRCGLTYKIGIRKSEKIILILKK